MPTDRPAKRRLLFDEFRVGQTFDFSRTFTAAELEAFVELSQDFNSYHTRPDWLATTRFLRPLLPGLLAGSMCTQIGGTIDMLATEIGFRFCKPAYPGQRLTLTLTVERLDGDKRMVYLRGPIQNEAGETVMEITLAGRPPSAEDNAFLYPETRGKEDRR